MFREGLNKSARADVEEICDRKRRETAANPDGFQGFTTNLWRKLTDRCRRRIYSVLPYVAASRNDALELLVFGAKAVMEAMDITLMEYLEALMTARETDSIEKILIDASIFSENF